MAKTPHGSMQPLAKDWVPLFLSFVSARQPQAMSEEASAPEAQNSDSDSDSDSDPQPNIQPQPEADAVTMVQAEQAGPTTGQTGSAETSSTSRVGAKAWKGQLKEWLGFIGGMKGAGGGFRSEDLKCSVVRQVQDTDSCVQQAALRCLKVGCHTL